MVLSMGMFKGRLPPTKNEVHRMGLGKKKKDGKNLPPPPGLPPLPMPPAPGMPMPPMPAPGMPLPPMPAPGMPLPPMPAPGMPMPLPPASPATPPPIPTPTEALPPLAAPPAHAIEALPPSLPPAPVVEEKNEEQSYSGLYAKKSGKPLQQVYGHIERISKGEIGSLLDRYSDRFGHELDRDIIIMRKDERDDKISEIRDSPTVQLLNQEEEEESHLDASTLVELNTQLKTVEDELRRLKPEYQVAKEEGDRELLRELRPSLESLMSERKLLKAVISGEADLDELLQDGDSEEEDDDDYEAESVDEEDEDIFTMFVSIVDDLLGGSLSKDAINKFKKSPGFEIYKTVVPAPEDADDDERSEFFAVVDALLGDMTKDAIRDFGKSTDFDIYREIGEMYR
jgi:hypothetical protein